MKPDLSGIELRETKVYYMKMNFAPQNNFLEKESISFIRLKNPVTPELYLHYYKTTGLKLNWLDRLVMPEKELNEKINAPNVHIYIMKAGQEEAGFIELVQEEKYVEIFYFGLFPEQIGKGLGKYFLNWGIHKAWSFNPEWIQLNTCELDHPNALPVYKKLGFEVYNSAIEQRRILPAKE